MINIQGNSANELFIKISNELLSNGNLSCPRGLKTLELQNVWIELSDPKKSVVDLKERKINLEYLNAELQWYKSGKLSIEEISKYSTFWNTLCDEKREINSNYGYLSMYEKFNDKTQLEWCIDKLSNDRETRQAIINYNQPKHKYEGNKDFVCTIAQLFRINNNKLDTTVMMRSNDLIYGLTYDMPWFTYLQKKLSDRLNIEPGIYNHFDASLHVYEKHFDMIKNIANAKI